MIWHNSDADSVLKELSSDKTNGLDSFEVLKRLSEYGKNEIHDFEKPNFFSMLLKQVINYLNLAMLISAVIYLVVAIITKEIKIAEPVFILLFICFNCLVNAYLEYRNTQKIDTLRNSYESYNTVVRDGTEQIILSSNIVPGDILILNAGDFIPADGRIIESYVLMCDEFSQTGETVPAEKVPDVVLDAITPMNDRVNMVFAGSFVKSGYAKVVVTETGEHTALGRAESIYKEIEKKPTPLEARLENIGKIFFIVSIIAAALIFLIGVLAHIKSYDVSFENTVFSHLLLGISVAASAIPQGIPSLLTVAVAFSVQRLRSNNITFIDLASAEAIGETSVICTDKTGVLTDENMNLVKLSSGSVITDLTKEKPNEAIVMLLNLALICSNMDTSRHMERHSNALELAIERASIKATGVGKAEIDGIYPCIAELPFDSTRRMMTSVTVINGKTYSVTKGAPEVVLSRCIDVDSEAVAPIVDSFASEGLTVLAVALKPLDSIPANPTSDELENGLMLVGFLGFDNPPDPVCKKEISECLKKNIRVIMLTGDHKKTAGVIAQGLGIIKDSSEIIDHTELEGISDEELFENISKYSVFSRATANDKLRIVRALRQSGERVLLTCDAVNDVPALSEADFGCALGQTGSESVKASAKLIVNDNKFSTLTLALKESNRIFDSVLRSLKFLISCTSTDIIVILFGLIIFGSSPVSAAALLLINLVITLSIKFAFSSEVTNSTLSLRRHESRELLSLQSLIGISIPSFIVSVMGLITFGVCLSGGLAEALSATITTLCISRIIHAFGLSHTYTVFQKGTVRNLVMPIACLISLVLILLVILTPLRSLISLSSLNGLGWLMVIISAAITFIADEAVKYFKKRYFAEKL